MCVCTFALYNFIISNQLYVQIADVYVHNMLLHVNYVIIGMHVPVSIHWPFGMTHDV